MEKSGGPVFFCRICYHKHGATNTAGGCFPRSFGNGVMRMVTYEALFAFCLVIIGIIALFQGNKK